MENTRMTTSDLGYALVDLDQHCYDQDDSFSRYIPSKYKDHVVHETVIDNELATMVGDRRVHLLDETRPPNKRVPKPGSLRAVLQSIKSGDRDDADRAFIPMQDEFLYRDARLKVMDEQGVQAITIYPTWALAVENYFDDVDCMYANFHSFNRWYNEEWGFNYQDRIFAPPHISLRDLDKAVEEVEYVVNHGARVVHMRGGPAYGRSPADPYFDPVWARLNEAKVTVAYHLTECGYNEIVAAHWGEDPDPPSWQQSAWQWACLYGDRSIMDTLAALIYGNLFGRFPNLTAVSVEFGAGWAPYLVRQLNKMKGMAYAGPWIGGRLNDRPSEVFRQHVLVTAFPEENIVDTVERLGHADSIVMGSDYPHAEGAARPQDYAHGLAGLSADDIHKIMRGNGLRVVAA
jgi:predicted TIM-barrel fold metal-dependent hydrolase